MPTRCKRYINKRENQWKEQGKLWDDITIEKLSNNQTLKLVTWLCSTLKICERNAPPRS